MLNAIRYAREKKVPYFGICLGMQTACIEFARNVCGLQNANSSEFDPATPHRVIYKLRELRGVEKLGGTMRLGAWTCQLAPRSSRASAYGGTRSPSATATATSSIRNTGNAQRRGLKHHRHHSRWNLRGNRRDPRSSVFPGLPVPSGIQVQALGAASAVRRVHRGFVRESATAPERHQHRARGNVSATGKVATGRR